MIDVGVRVGAVIVVAALACAGAPALADLPNPLADGLRHCAGESDQGKRLACFDALAAGLPKVEADQFGLTADIAHKRQPRVKGRPGASGAGGAVAGGTAAAASGGGAAGGTVAGSAGAGGATGASMNGAAGNGAKAAAPATGVAAGAAGTEGTADAGATRSAESKPAGQFLPGKITALRQGAGGVLVFTLDNNQVWAQANADTRFSFNVGEDVRIEHGAMGSFWLAASKGRKTKVKRVS